MAVLELSKVSKHASLAVGAFNGLLIAYVGVLPFVDPIRVPNPLLFLLVLMVTAVLFDRLRSRSANE